MAPGIITLALGMDHKPSENTSVFISPITGKTTFVNNDSLSNEGAYGVNPGKKSLHEYGSLLSVKYKNEILKNINLNSKVSFFSSFGNNPENIDVNWEMAINMKVNKYFTTQIRTHLIYDHDTKIADDMGTLAPRVQFKEAFGFGIAYSFPEK
jgi:hypothetical protein